MKKSKAQLRREYNNYRAKAEQYQEAMRKKLVKMLGVGSRHSLPGGNPDGRWDTEGLQQMGGLRMQHGVNPNDQQVAAYIRQMGGNPYLQKAEEMQKRMQGSSNRGSGPSKGVVRQATQRINQRAKEDSALQKFFEEVQAKQDAANKANEDRYQDILGRLEASRERNLERVSNYGEASRQDLEERAQNTLGDIEANLAARGLGNSTILDAFRQRNERDLAREQQRLSEQVDSRTAEYDQQLSQDIAAFMERRNDTAPDIGQFMQLAQQYGLSGDGLGFNATAEDVNAAGPQQLTFGKSSSEPEVIDASAGTTQRRPRIVPYMRAPIFANPIPTPSVPGFQGWTKPRSNRRRRRKGKKPPTNNIISQPPIFDTFDPLSGISREQYA